MKKYVVDIIYQIKIEAETPDEAIAQATLIANEGVPPAVVLREL